MGTARGSFYVPKSLKLAQIQMGSSRECVHCFHPLPSLFTVEENRRSFGKIQPSTLDKQAGRIHRLTQDGICNETFFKGGENWHRKEERVQIKLAALTDNIPKR